MCIRDRVSTQSTWANYADQLRYQVAVFSAIKNIYRLNARLTTRQGLEQRIFFVDALNNVLELSKTHITEADLEDFLPLLQANAIACLLYTSPSPRDGLLSRMPSSA
eukprot:TRINITY_DN22863_c0_g1_i1.p2 TRINITY_DN22863_c0_g1~~TRINITY_DN22863_c0_g1_i1.p2  ORF type:complete len:115 (-),score=53.42 TRINITY_DN22863_c0_g1_i1:10-330(-)